MKYEDLFNRFPEKGFIKTSLGGKKDLSAQQKALLNRKGNELLNRGDSETAKRIFITTGYSDGMIRIGDLYLSRNRPLDAFQMYWMAPDKRKSGELIEKMAAIIQNLLGEEED
jgi:hypothetical protein